MNLLEIENLKKSYKKGFIPKRTEVLKGLSFTVPAYRDRTFGGVVYDIGSFADPETREVICWARVNNYDAKLKPGFFAHVDLLVDSREEAVVVPLASVLPTELGMTAYVAFATKTPQAMVKLPLTALFQEKSASSVWIVDHGSVKLIPVQVAGSSGNDIIVSSGLTPGQTVVTAGVNLLKPGQKVKILDDDPALKTQARLAATEAASSSSASAGVEK